MKVGDLVRWKPHLPFALETKYGILIEIIDEFVVGVMWVDSECIYMESVDNLEAMHEEGGSSKG